jgi:hypothetical protein
LNLAHHVARNRLLLGSQIERCDEPRGRLIRQLTELMNIQFASVPIF